MAGNSHAVQQPMGPECYLCAREAGRISRINESVYENGQLSPSMYS